MIRTATAAGERVRYQHTPLTTRLVTSPFANHLRLSARTALWPAVGVSSLILGVATRDVAVTWGGVVDLTGGLP